MPRVTSACWSWTTTRSTARGWSPRSSTMPGTRWSGEAGDGAEAVAAAAELRPDVVVMDLHMPVLNGVDATRQITARSPAVAVLVLTMLEGDDSVFAAVRAGARGYLLKGADRAEIAPGARRGGARRGGVLRRDRPAGAGLLRRPGARRVAEPFPELTEREREVLDLVARGLTNAEIARRLVRQRQDRAQPRVERLRQAARRRPRRGRRPGPGRGAGGRSRSRLMTWSGWMGT